MRLRSGGLFEVRFVRDTAAGEDHNAAKEVWRRFRVDQGAVQGAGEGAGGKPPKVVDWVHIRQCGAKGKRIENNVPKVSPEERRRRKVRRENMDALRDWRKKAARELELPSERLMHRRHLEAIGKALPRTREELLAVVPLNDWQRESFESSLLEALESLPDPELA